MDQPRLTGIKGVKIPVSDLTASLAWYRAVLGAEPSLEFPDEDGVVRGVACTLPGLEEGLALRESPEHAAGARGFNPVIFRVPDRDAVAAWIEHLDRLGIDHSPLVEASIGYLVAFDDPDGIELHVYSDEAHGEDVAGRAGYGRAAGG
ncbi:VOC family protein [Rothia sp. AR01]|uniref:VOC family protein n=1 Tax=Rothia santali TaxID=2949643 RepID=A0A9X2HI56_9MICC|nr:VOC family protein [Rothia santali]MCP3425313.1 VOC family protein [Rothia santali]